MCIRRICCLVVLSLCVVESGCSIRVRSGDDAVGGPVAPPSELIIRDETIRYPPRR